MIQLYSYRRCPFAIRVRMTLEEKGISYQTLEENLSHPSAQLLQLHPEGRVPLLVHDELVIYESSIITEYLNEQFPETPLMPSSATDRMKVRLWTYWCNSIFKPDLDLFKYEQSGMSLKDQDSLNSRLKTHLDQLEAPLHQSHFLIGPDLTLADIHLFPFYRQLQRVNPKFDNLSERTALNSWLERITSRPSFFKVMEKKQ